MAKKKIKPETTMINLSRETLHKLVSLKYSVGLKNYDEVLLYLINEVKGKNA